MTTHRHGPRVVERHCDVAVVGGSAAGLAAALQLARQRRSVIVIDAGEPRNAPAAHMHSFLTRDGTPPARLLELSREEVRAYGVEVLDGRVTDVVPTENANLSFRVELTGGHTVIARRVLAAVGLVDVLPEIDGLAEHWGRAVLHCPFCHGYEVRDRRIVQIVTDERNLHPTPLWAHLAAPLTVVLHGGVDEGHPEVAALQASGVPVVARRVQRVADDGEDGSLRIELDGGDVIEADAIAVGPRFTVPVGAFTGLGAQPAPHPTGLGEHLVVDATGQTDVRGLYAAGNVTDPSQQVLQAAADGSRVGGMIGFDLAREDVSGDGARSANETDWDRRYGDGQVWSGNPNGTLVREVTQLPPGRALDVGAGEGADAIWLAERGWTVTANEVSGRALERLAAEAERRALPIERLHVDANALDAFPRDCYDLVTAMYAAIPRTADGRGVANLLDAVAPGGTLLVVSHDLEPMRAPIDTTTQSRAYDPDAYVRVEDVAAVLAELPGWTIDVHERRPRPKGSATDAHHVDDVVLRAHRDA